MEHPSQNGHAGPHESTLWFRWALWFFTIVFAFLASAASSKLTFEILIHFFGDRFYAVAMAGVAEATKLLLVVWTGYSLSRRRTWPFRYVVMRRVLQLSCFSLGLYTCVAWSCLLLSDPNRGAILESETGQLMKQAEEELTEIHRNLDPEIEQIQETLSRERDNVVGGVVEGPRYVAKSKDLADRKAEREARLRTVRERLAADLKRLKADMDDDPRLINKALFNLTEILQAVFHLKLDARLFVFGTAVLLATMLESSIYVLWFAAASEIPASRNPGSQETEDLLRDLEEEAGAEAQRRRFDQILKKTGIRLASDAAVHAARRTTRDLRREFQSDSPKTNTEPTT